MKISKRLKQNRKNQKAQNENNSYRRQRRSNTLITEFSKEEKQNNTPKPRLKAIIH